MTIENRITCDGCGAVETVKPNEPATKTAIAVAVAVGTMPVLYYDLCGACERRLVRDSDPAAWRKVRGARHPSGDC